jgi:hypothetical protein
LNRLKRKVNRSVGSSKDDPLVGLYLVDFCLNFGAAQAGHPLIQQDKVKVGVFSEELKTLGSIFRDRNSVTRVLKGQADHQSNIRLVVNDEDTTQITSLQEERGLISGQGEGELRTLSHLALNFDL